MDEQRRNKQLVQEHYAAFWGGDESLIRQQVSDDYVDHGMPGSPVGVEPVLAHSRVFRESFPDMKVIVNTSVAEGDRVAVHATWQGTHKATFQGVPATNKVMTGHDLRGNGLLAYRQWKTCGTMGYLGHYCYRATIAAMTISRVFCR